MPHWGQPFLMYYIYQAIATHGRHGRPPFYQQSRSTHQNHIGKPGNTPDAVSISQAGKETIRYYKKPTLSPVFAKRFASDAPAGYHWCRLLWSMDYIWAGEVRSTGKPFETCGWQKRWTLRWTWCDRSEAMWSGTQWNSEFDPPDSFCKQFERV